MLLSVRRTRWVVFSVRVCACLLLAGVAISGTIFGAGQEPQSGARPPQSAASAPPSREAMALLDEANGLLARNDFAGAEADYQKALQSFPDWAAAHRGLGIALWREGALARAWQELSTVARLEPDSGQAHFELGRLAWEIYSGPSERVAATGLSADDLRSMALRQVQRASALEPRDFNMRLELAEIELEAGKNKEAEADALGSVSLASSAPERAQAHVALARAYSATGDEVRSEAEYRKALEENASSGPAYLGLGQISLEQRDPGQAEKYFNQAIHVSPELGAAYAALAKVYLAARQLGQAIGLFKKAVALDPGDWQSQFELGKLQMRSGDAAGAKELFTKIVAARPDFLPAGEELALMQLRQGDVQGAIAQAQALAARDPGAAEGHRVLALAYWRERQNDASLAECAQALAVDPHSISMQALQAFVLWQSKRHGDARRVLRDVATRDPEILLPVTFCREIVCGSADVMLVGAFLRDNRWILRTPADQ
ncbi:MAG TPA: tetratricopeptide repeat protein [Terriglobia bacterium]|nr:tetratricopeptide repeat protein [Terriglobia bacterium]